MAQVAALAPRSSPFQRLRLLGGEVDLLEAADLLDFIERRIDVGRGAIIANHNLHSLYLHRKLERMRAFYQFADLIEADSKPLIMWGRLLGHPIGSRHRCTYLDWREAFWERARSRGWKVFYLGGRPGVAAAGAQAVRDRHPGLQIASRHGYFDAAPSSEGNQQALADIEGFGPSIVMIGMGMPRQEQWILDNQDRLAGYVVLPIGAAFDYEAGAIPTPPRWMGRLGLEWAFRFACEPGRLFSRYFIEPWALVIPAFHDLLAILPPLGL